MRRAALAALVVVAVGAAPADARTRHVTPDGSAAIFATFESHSPADTDTSLDLYRWRAGTLELVGPGSGVSISDDGDRVHFRTDEALVPEDTNSGTDLYEWENGTTKLVSSGPVGDFFSPQVSADGRTVALGTLNRLTPQDTDDDADIYERKADGTLTLVSTSSADSPGGNYLENISDDGRRILWWTKARHRPNEDTDTAPDLYESVDGVTYLVSKGSTTDSTPAASGVTFRHATPDGKSVVFDSYDRLTAGDSNDTVDLYQRNRGKTILVTAASDGSNSGSICLGPPQNRYPPCYPWIQGQSEDGLHVLFTSDAIIGGRVADDLPLDVPRRGLFDRTATSTRWLGEAPFGSHAISANGKRVIALVPESHSDADTDEQRDIYAYEAGTWRLLSGSAPEYISHLEASYRAERVYFETGGSLVPGDTDGGSNDVYLYAFGEGLQPGLAPFDAPGGLYLSDIWGMSETGSIVYFATDVALVPEDTDTRRDLYRRANGVTELLSGG